MAFLNLTKHCNKSVIIGCIVGLLSTAIGSLLYIYLFSNYGLTQTFKNLQLSNSLNKLINLGAFLNLGVFFYFLHNNQDHKAKGVLIATIAIAIIFAINKIL